MLSMRTNSASLSAQNALSRAVYANATSGTRLSTGYRINSAMDDAAGFQIATRLAAQSSGMTMAMRNIQNGISLMQVADTVSDSLVGIFTRMHDLAIQAADATSAQADKEALQSEFVELFDQAWQVVSTTYNGESLFVNTGAAGSDKFMQPLKFQIGDSSSDVMTADLSDALIQTLPSFKYGDGDVVDILTMHPSEAIADMAFAIDVWASFRSVAGAVANALEHASNNVANMLTNTKAATGRIMDTDFAMEVAVSSTAQMLMQSSTSMLKQASAVTQMTLSLIS